jgi:hypothetical protein
VPVDSHLLTIFRLLGWIPNEEGNNCSFLCQASIEGWFPKEKWGELNQVYAGLGQLFRDQVNGRKFLIHAWNKCEDPSHPLTYQDFVQLEKIARAYGLIL